jgi:nucleotide-binding universal stress UspA family protein
MSAITRVLFPTDFSAHAEHAWSYGLLLAAQFSAEIHVLHVLTPPPRLTEAYAAQIDPEALLASARTEATAVLERHVREAKTRGLVCHPAIRAGVDFREIIDYARASNVDLIVMATHGRTGLAHVLLGSVAEKVVRKAPCPVLTVKHPAMQIQAG